jgi:ribulose-phosphate 3-epimerase
MSVPIVPAIIPKSEAAVIEYATALSFSRELHLDVVDGRFVPSVSWPYVPAGEPHAVKHYTDSFTLEVDLMVEDPVPAAVSWEVAGADMIIMHAETVSLEAFTAYCESTRLSVGIAFHGATNFEQVAPYIAVADYVQVMGIDSIGAQGQAFSERTFEKIERIAQQFPQTPISVDGGVNQKTISRLVKAGAARCIVGSAIVGQVDYEAAYRSLQQAVNGCE